MQRRAGAARRSAGGSQRPRMMKAAEEGSGSRLRGAHQHLIGPPLLGDRSAVRSADIDAGKSDATERGQGWLRPAPGSIL
jgi:hypothetical protein